MQPAQISSAISGFLDNLSNFVQFDEQLRFRIIPSGMDSCASDNHLFTKLCYQFVSLENDNNREDMEQFIFELIVI